jgi:hypothetical protein
MSGIAYILRQAEGGTTATEVCRQFLRLIRSGHCHHDRGYYGNCRLSTIFISALDDDHQDWS